MKKLLLGLVSLTLLFSACKKKDDNGTPSNSITINGTSYTMLSTNGFTANSGLISISAINGTNAAGLAFYFNSTPTASGTYKVVDINATTQANNEVSFSAATSASNIYESTGAGTVNATVTVNGGKISISMPDAPALQSVGGTATVNVNCNVTQP